MNTDDKIYLLSSDKTEITICKNLNKNDEIDNSTIICDNLEKNIKKLCKKYNFINKLFPQHFDNKIKHLTANIQLLINEIDETIIENGKINNNTCDNFDLEYI